MHTLTSRGQAPLGYCGNFALETIKVPGCGKGRKAPPRNAARSTEQLVIQVGTVVNSKATTLTVSVNVQNSQR